jgi:hypothetical protein
MDELLDEIEEVYCSGAGQGDVGYVRKIVEDPKTIEEIDPVQFWRSKYHTRENKSK